MLWERCTQGLPQQMGSEGVQWTVQWAEVRGAYHWGTSACKSSLLPAWSWEQCWWGCSIHWPGRASDRVQEGRTRHPRGRSWRLPQWSREQVTTLTALFWMFTRRSVQLINPRWGSRSCGLSAWLRLCVTGDFANCLVSWRFVLSWWQVNCCWPSIRDKLFSLLLGTKEIIGCFINL